MMTRAAAICRVGAPALLLGLAACATGPMGAGDPAPAPVVAEGERSIVMDIGSAKIRASYLPDQPDGAVRLSYALPRTGFPRPLDIDADIAPTLEAETGCSLVAAEGGHGTLTEDSTVTIPFTC